MTEHSKRVRKAYDAWSAVYDTNVNPTRDLNAAVIRRYADLFSGKRVLEAGCGSGLNTEWLAGRAREVVAVDLSEGMLDRARRRVRMPNVHFDAADLTEPWRWEGPFDVIVVNLVLEHIADPGHVFSEAYPRLAPGGLVYVAELHPYRQIAGSRARFDDPATGEQVLVPVVRHTISEFTNCAVNAGFRIRELGEHDDGGDIPRLFTMWLDRP